MKKQNSIITMREHVMADMAVHKSRRTTGLEMQPDLVLVSCSSLGVESVFDPE